MWEVNQYDLLIKKQRKNIIDEFCHGSHNSAAVKVNPSTLNADVSSLRIDLNAPYLGQGPVGLTPLFSNKTNTSVKSEVALLEPKVEIPAAQLNDLAKNVKAFSVYEPQYNHLWEVLFLILIQNKGLLLVFFLCFSLGC